MFIPNNQGTLRRKRGTNINAETIYHDPIRGVPCAVVHMKASAEKTNVRADSSASRGNADEPLSFAKILFPTAVKPKVGDHFEIAEFQLEVAKIEPRWSVAGLVDHYECDLDRLEIAR